MNETTETPAAEEAVTVGDSGLEPLVPEHNPNAVGPASAAPAAHLSGDPLDPTTKAAMAGSPPAAG